MNIRTHGGYSTVFPQANDIYRVYNLCISLRSGIKEYKKLLLEIGVGAIRQLHYYFSASEYLGLTDKNKKLTSYGSFIFSQDKNTILELLCYTVLSVDVFANYYVTRNKNLCIEFMKTNYDISKTTLPRRFSTLKQWVVWCDIIIQDFELSVIFED